MKRKDPISMLVWPLTMTFVSLTFVSLSAAPALAQWREPRRETVFAEAGFGVSGDRHDGYVRRLEGQGYGEDPFRFSVVPTVSVGVMLPSRWQHADLGLVFRYEHLEHQWFEREVEGSRDEIFAWDSKAASLGLRVRRRLAKEWLALYGQLQAGLGYAQTAVGREDREHERMHYGVSVGGVAGLATNFFKYGGMFFEAGYTHAPILKNGAGQRHNDGGTSLLFGFRVRLVARTQ